MAKARSTTPELPLPRRGTVPFRVFPKYANADLVISERVVEQRVAIYIPSCCIDTEGHACGEVARRLSFFAGRRDDIQVTAGHPRVAPRTRDERHKTTAWGRRRAGDLAAGRGSVEDDEL